jgi:hypothetical protein
VFSDPFALAVSATKYRIAMITVVSKEFVNISEKKLSALYKQLGFVAIAFGIRHYKICLY